MFTSKKAQYLTNNFEHISPITNIDSLYFEKITKNGKGYKINRQSVVKNMPIQCDALLYEYRKKYQSMYNYTNIHNDITNVSRLVSATIQPTTKFCVPYNDDTKHLVGTTDEAPEYYRYWEDQL